MITAFNLWRMIGSGVFVLVFIVAIVYLIFKAKTIITTSICCVLMIPVVLFAQNFFGEILKFSNSDDISKISQELSVEKEKNQSLQNEISFLKHAQLSIQDLERIIELNVLKTSLHQTEVKDTWIGEQKIYENYGKSRTQIGSIGKNYLIILTHDLTAKYGIDIKNLKAFEDENGNLIICGLKPVFTGMMGIKDEKKYADVINTRFSSDGSIYEKSFSLDKKDLKAASDYADWCINEFHKKVENMTDLDANVYEQVADSAQNLLTVLLSAVNKNIIFSNEENEKSVPLTLFLQRKIEEKEQLIN